MTPVRKVSASSNAASIGRSNGVTLSATDATLSRELVQFAIEALTETMETARINARWANGSRPIVRQIERYRDAAAELLERLRA